MYEYKDLNLNKWFHFTIHMATHLFDEHLFITIECTVEQIYILLLYFQFCRCGKVHSCSVLKPGCLTELNIMIALFKIILLVLLFYIFKFYR